MSGPPGEPAWNQDDEIDRLRLYAVTGGRTEPDRPLDLATVVQAGPGDPPRLSGTEHGQIHRLCQAEPRSVAELAGLLRQPATVVKILVADLLETGALRPAAPTFQTDLTDLNLLERVLAGLRELKV